MSELDPDFIDAFKQIIQQNVLSLQDFAEIIHLHAISPIDGRYNEIVNELRPIFSEHALIKRRVIVECRWFQFILKLLYNKDNSTVNTFIEKLIKNYNEIDSLEIKKLEKITNHDVKAVEYYLKKKFEQSEIPLLIDNIEKLHMLCTSEDINSICYGIILKDGVKIILNKLYQILDKLNNMIKQYHKISMLCRTHGQPATPHTMGKEFANYYNRLLKQYNKFKTIIFTAKFNGATGCYNTHNIMDPTIDWINQTSDFIRSFGLEPNIYTSQIEPHDFIADICDNIRHICNILIGFDMNMWLYISREYFTLTTIKGQIGSSTMPQKVNPINFENSEGNLKIANCMFEMFSRELLITRGQRDLTDSTILRKIGDAFSHVFIAFNSLIKGLNLITVNEVTLSNELNSHWEVLAEPIQTILRKYNIPGAYEQLLDLTRGKKITKDIIHNFLNKIETTNENFKKDIIMLLELTPDKYIGKSELLCLLPDVSLLPE